MLINDSRKITNALSKSLARNYIDSDAKAVTAIGNAIVDLNINVTDENKAVDILIKGTHKLVGSQPPLLTKEETIKTLEVAAKELETEIKQTNVGIKLIGPQKALRNAVQEGIILNIKKKAGILEDALGLGNNEKATKAANDFANSLGIAAVSLEAQKVELKIEKELYLDSLLAIIYVVINTTIAEIAGAGTGTAEAVATAAELGIQISDIKKIQEVVDAITVAARSVPFIRLDYAREVVKEAKKKSENHLEVLAIAIAAVAIVENQAGSTVRIAEIVKSVVKELGIIIIDDKINALNDQLQSGAPSLKTSIREIVGENQIDIDNLQYVTAFKIVNSSIKVLTPTTPFVYVTLDQSKEGISDAYKEFKTMPTDENTALQILKLVAKRLGLVKSSSSIQSPEEVARSFAKAAISLRCNDFVQLGQVIPPPLPKQPTEGYEELRKLLSEVAIANNEIADPALGSVKKLEPLLKILNDELTLLPVRPAITKLDITTLSKALEEAAVAVSLSGKPYVASAIALTITSAAAREAIILGEPDVRYQILLAESIEEIIVSATLSINKRILYLDKINEEIMVLASSLIGIFKPLNKPKSSIWDDPLKPPPSKGKSLKILASVALALRGKTDLDSTNALQAFRAENAIYQSSRRLSIENLAEQLDILATVFNKGTLPPSALQLSITLMGILSETNTVPILELKNTTTIIEINTKLNIIFGSINILNILNAINNLNLKTENLNKVIQIITNINNEYTQQEQIDRLKNGMIGILPANLSANPPIVYNLIHVIETIKEKLSLQLPGAVESSLKKLHSNLTPLINLDQSLLDSLEASETALATAELSNALLIAAISEKESSEDIIYFNNSSSYQKKWNTIQVEEKQSVRQLYSIARNPTREETILGITYLEKDFDNKVNEEIEETKTIVKELAPLSANIRKVLAKKELDEELKDKNATEFKRISNYQAVKENELNSKQLQTEKIPLDLVNAATIALAIPDKYKVKYLSCELAIFSRKKAEELLIKTVLRAIGTEIVVSVKKLFPGITEQTSSKISRKLPGRHIPKSADVEYSPSVISYIGRVLNHLEGIKTDINNRVFRDSLLKPVLNSSYASGISSRKKLTEISARDALVGIAVFLGQQTRNLSEYIVGNINILYAKSFIAAAAVLKFQKLPRNSTAKVLQELIANFIPDPDITSPNSEKIINVKLIAKKIELDPIEADEVLLETIELSKIENVREIALDIGEAVINLYKRLNYTYKVYIRPSRTDIKRLELAKAFEDAAIALALMPTTGVDTLYPFGQIIRNPTKKVQRSFDYLRSLSSPDTTSNKLKANKLKANKLKANKLKKLQHPIIQQFLQVHEKSDIKTDIENLIKYLPPLLQDKAIKQIKEYYKVIQIFFKKYVETYNYINTDINDSHIETNFKELIQILKKMDSNDDSKGIAESVDFLAIKAKQNVIDEYAKSAASSAGIQVGGAVKVRDDSDYLKNELLYLYEPYIRNKNKYIIYNNLKILKELIDEYKEEKNKLILDIVAASTYLTHQLYIGTPFKIKNTDKSRKELLKEFVQILKKESIVNEKYIENIYFNKNQPISSQLLPLPQTPPLQSQTTPKTPPLVAKTPPLNNLQLSNDAKNQVIEEAAIKKISDIAKEEIIDAAAAKAVADAAAALAAAKVGGGSTLKLSDISKKLLDRKNTSNTYDTKFWNDISRIHIQQMRKNQFA